MRVTAGEWRYVLLLIPLLVLVAVASVTMVSYVESLLLDLEEQHAYREFDRQLGFEKTRLMELAQFTAEGAAAAPEESYEAFLARAVRAQNMGQFNLELVAIVRTDATVVAEYFLPELRSPPTSESAEAYLVWSNLVPVLARAPDSWAGFARARTGLVLVALARIPRAEGAAPGETALLALVRPFDAALVQRIRERYTDFVGVATPETIREPDTHLVPVRDAAGRQLGQLVFRWDPSRIEDAVEGFRWAILALTGGLLFLAGSLGLWAIRSTLEIESLKRVGRFVDAMDYFHDGLVAVDKKGHITGCNPSARAMAGRKPRPRESVCDLFPMLSEEDWHRLTSSERPREIEKTLQAALGQRIWRFRTQPSEGFHLLLISDVTDEKTQEMRKRQITTLQMIGRVARGVAHDFNNILCAISGHATLLGLPPSLTEEDRASLKAIQQEAERGANLAAHLLELSRVRGPEEPAERLEEHVEKAAGLLRIGLSSAWQVVTDAEKDFPAVPLSAVQVEQVVLNLGLLVADELGGPGTVRLAVRRPTPRDPLLDVGEGFAAVILIAARRGEEAETYPPREAVPATTAAEMGVIQSVARTMLEEVGGRLDVLLTADGRHSYRVCLPGCGPVVKPVGRIAEEWVTYLGHWKVLLAVPPGPVAARLKSRLEALGTQIQVADDLVDALSRVDKDRTFTAMIFDKDLLGTAAEADGLLRAILKLQPSAGLVVLCDAKETAPPELADDVIFESRDAEVEALCEAMIRAREKVAQRKRRA